MATPVPVSELYTMADGSTPPRGSAVTFTLTAPLTDTVTGAIIPADPVRVPLDAGALAVTLFATDDPTTSPSGVTYRADEVLGTETRSFYFALPYNGGAQVLGLLAPADIAPAVTYGIASLIANSPLSRTVVNGVVTLSLDSSNFATDAELAAEASTRAGADTTLTNAITAEASTARAAESATAGALTTHTGQTTDAHGGIVGSADPRLTDSRAPTAHTLAGALHTASGLTTGHVLRATGASAFAWGQPAHSDLSGIGADDHHAKSHGHTGADGSGTVAHSALTGQTVDDHHAKSHTHNADGSGSLVAASLPTHTHAEADTTNLTTDLTARALAVLFPLATGYWYGASSPTSTTGALTEGAVYACPWLVSRSCTVDQLAIEVVTTPGGTGSVIRLGIYNTVAGLPSAVVADAGTVVGTSTGVVTKTGLSIPLTPGLYWLAAVNQGGASPVATTRLNSGTVAGVGSTTTDLISSNPAAYIIATSVSGALTTATQAARTTSGHRVVAHISA